MNTGFPRREVYFFKDTERLEILTRAGEVFHLSRGLDAVEQVLAEAAMRGLPGTLPATSASSNPQFIAQGLVHFQHPGFTQGAGPVKQPALINRKKLGAVDMACP